MRIHFSVRKHAFTVLGNEVLRDRRLSFTARGILAHLLSLPDGAREDVRTLADRNPGLGRRGVAKALDELVESGYYARRTVRDEASGQVRTETHVFDSPQPEGSPLPVRAGTGRASTGRTGIFPKGKKNPVEVPPTPAADTTRRARRAGRAGEKPSGPAAPAAPATPPDPAAPAEPDAPASAEYTLLAGLATTEPGLALGIAEVIELAPLAAPWLHRGLSDLEIRTLLTSGLPETVHSPRALLADRLTRKLPAPRTAPGAAPATPLAECTACRNPLPRGHDAEVCAACAGAGGAARPSTPALTPVTVPAVGGPPSARERIRALRSALHARPALTAAAT